MTYIAQGSATQLHWLQQRLARRGLPALADAGGAPPWLPADWQGFYLPSGSWINIDTDHQAALQPRQRHCQDHGAQLLELDGAWQALGRDFGFMLLLGAEQTPSAAAAALLDALAPLPAAWLRCGPVGSARYTRQVWEGLLFMLRQHAPPTPDTPIALDWENALRRQWQLWEKLLQLSLRYLERHGLDADAASARQAFAEAPWRQHHYAASLARLIVAAGGCQQAWQQLWSTLAAHAPAAPN
ncbi:MULTISPECIES: hypothetical protein [Chromobacterium]|uniref:Uncharacterized protein n=1 Tax=Chromobacterium aquaticum TaxID=467180 RepID=A0ABV8ZSC6_9NEIS|nr:hypothetical protein [Chromobacterium aquaticum]MCD5363177.1 hypothetical protein [Chromobacterium aquaticum]